MKKHLRFIPSGGKTDLSIMEAPKGTESPTVTEIYGDYQVVMFGINPNKPIPFKFAADIGRWIERWEREMDNNETE